MFRSVAFKWTCIICSVFVLIFMGGYIQAEETDHYLIGEGDVLDIAVWKEPELSRLVKVRVDGRISMPLVDDVLAAGRTPLELKEIVTGRLEEFVEAPEVTVIVHQQVSKSYYVLGEVRQQGEFPLEKDVNVLQAIAKTNGFTEWASKRNILLLRRSGGDQQSFNIDYRDIISGSNPELNMQLRAGDTIVVP